MLRVITQMAHTSVNAMSDTLATEPTVMILKSVNTGMNVIPMLHAMRLRVLTFVFVILDTLETAGTAQVKIMLIPTTS